MQTHDEETDQSKWKDFCKVSKLESYKGGQCHERNCFSSKETKEAQQLHGMQNSPVSPERNRAY